MRVVYIGTGDIGLPALAWLIREHEVAAVVAQPDKPVGRKQILTPPPTKALALEHGIPVLQPRRIRDAASVAELAAFAPDLIVVMAYGQILSKAILDLPRLGCLNLHASLLPAHRGAAPIQAAILAGDRETGTTIMWMDEGLDTGDMLLAHKLPIRRRETGGSLHDRLAALSPAVLAEALPLIEAGTAPRIPQETARATYAAKLSRETGLIDWRAPSAVIERQVRALNPWPASSTRIPDAAGGPSRQLKVFSVIRCRKSSGEPGIVLRADKRGILVGTGEGALLLREIQMEGKRRMAVRDFLSGHPLAPGVKLG